MPTELKYKLSADVEQLKQDLGIICKFPGEFAKATEDSKKKFVEAWQQQRDEVEGVDAALKELHKDADSMTLSTMEKVKGLINNYSEFRQSLLARGGGYEMAGTLMPQQLGGITSGLQHLKSSVLSELPFGGLVGLMLYGAQRYERVRAEATDAVRVFEQVGHTGSAQINKVGREFYNLGIALGKDVMPELRAISEGLAGFGVKVEEINQKSFLKGIDFNSAKAGVQGINESVAMTFSRLDAVFKLPAGTTARQAGEMSKNFGVSINEAQAMLAKFGSAARESHQNVMVFTQGVMASGAVLRNQRIDLNEVAEAQLRLQKAIASTIAPGGTERERMRWAADYSQQAMGQITAGIKGMDLGWATVIGEKMKQAGTLEKGATGLDVAFRVKEGLLKEGAKPEEQLLVGNVIKESVTMALQATGGKESEARMLLGAQFNMDPTGPGTRALLEIAKKTKPEDMMAALDANKEYIAGAFKDRAAETSAFQRALLKAQDGIAKIGIGLLGAVIGGFAQVVAVVQWAYYSLTKQSGKADEASDRLVHYIGQTEKSFGMVGAGMKSLAAAGKIAGETIGDVPGLGFQFYDETKRKRRGAGAPDVGVSEALERVPVLGQGVKGIKLGAEAIGTAAGFYQEQGLLPTAEGIGQRVVMSGKDRELQERNERVIAEKRREVEAQLAAEGREGELVSVTKTYLKPPKIKAKAPEGG